MSFKKEGKLISILLPVLLSRVSWPRLKVVTVGAKSRFCFEESCATGLAYLGGELDIWSTEEFFVLKLAVSVSYRRAPT